MLMKEVSEGEGVREKEREQRGHQLLSLHAFAALLC